MTAQSFLDFAGLRNHPDFCSLVDDLHDDFYDVGMAFLDERAKTDPLVRAMLHPAYRIWSVEHVPASVLRAGLRVSYRIGEREGVHGVIDYVSGEWVGVESPEASHLGRLSFRLADWDSERDWATVPIPLDAAILARKEPAA